MEIVYDHQIFTRQRHGGISRYICELAARIPALCGDSALVFSPLHVNDYLSAGQRPFGPRIRLPGRRPFKGIADHADWILGFACLRSKRNISIFHETYYSSTSYSPPSAKRVVTVHDMTHERLPHLSSKVKETTRKKREAISRADAIICVSRNTRDDLCEIFGMPAQKTHVVHHGFSLSQATPVHASDQRIAMKPFLLFVGQRGGYKNFASLLKAFGSSGRLRRELSIVCFGGGGLSKEEADLLRDLDIPPQAVSFVSGDDSKLTALYVGASALVYPSLYEGFGIPPLEAMSHDCPVICSNNSSLPEVVGDAAETFNPALPEDICAAIERVVFSPTRSADLVVRGRARIRQFSWDRCARETLDVYNTTLASR